MNVRYRFILFYSLVLLVWVYLHFHSKYAVPVAKPLSDFPTICHEWHMTSQTNFSEDILNVLKATDYLSRSYEGVSARRIGLYIGYHDGGKESGEIHSPKHCLPGSGWQKLSSERMDLNEPLGKINLIKAVYQKNERKELFLYWFQVQDKTLSDEYSLKLAGITSSIIHGRKDAAFIRISVPFEVDEHEATATGVRFIQDVYPLIREFIPS
jgi:EpsI family protein